MKLLILSAFAMISISARAQELLLNDGAIITVQTGATLYVEGGIKNTATGTIDNNGIIEIKGNFENLGTWDAIGANTLKFSGDSDSNFTPSDPADLTPNEYQTVVVQKGTTFNVNLLGHLTVNTNLDFNAPAPGTGNKIKLGTKNLTLGSTATTTGFDSDEFVVTDGTGTMRKIYTSLTGFQYPVGFSATTYNPATLTPTAGPNDTYTVRVGDHPTDGNGLTGTPLTDVVDAVWEIKELGTLGDNTVDLTVAWSVADQLGTFSQTSNFISKNDGTTGWDGLFSQLGGAGTTRTRTGITGFSAFAVGGKPLANDLVLNAKVFLQGPYSGGGVMSDLLRTAGPVPTTQPYTAAPYNYVHVGFGGGETSTSFVQGGNNDVVDWMIVELRNSAAPATILASRAALIQQDGDIVDLDGTSHLKIKGLADASYYVALKHRNHLPIRTQTTRALSNTVTAVDFTVAGTAFDNGSLINEPMADLGSGVFGMFAGDVDGDNIVNYAIGDRAAILARVGDSTPSNLVNNVYDRTDVTMDGQVNYAIGDRAFILDNVVGSGNPSRLVTAHQ